MPVGGSCNGEALAIEMQLSGICRGQLQGRCSGMGDDVAMERMMPCIGMAWEMQLQGRGGCHVDAVAMDMRLQGICIGS